MAGGNATLLVCIPEQSEDRQVYTSARSAQNGMSSLIS